MFELSCEVESPPGCTTSGWRPVVMIRSSSRAMPPGVTFAATPAAAAAASAARSRRHIGPHREPARRRVLLPVMLPTAWTCSGLHCYTTTQTKSAVARPTALMSHTWHRSSRPIGFNPAGLRRGCGRCCNVASCVTVDSEEVRLWHEPMRVQPSVPRSHGSNMLPTVVTMQRRCDAVTVVTGTKHVKIWDPIQGESLSRDSFHTHGHTKAALHARAPPSPAGPGPLAVQGGRTDHVMI